MNISAQLDIRRAWNSMHEVGAAILVHWVSMKESNPYWLEETQHEYEKLAKVAEEMYKRFMELEAAKEAAEHTAEQEFGEAEEAELQNLEKQWEETLERLNNLSDLLKQRGPESPPVPPEGEPPF